MAGNVNSALDELYKAMGEADDFGVSDNTDGDEGGEAAGDEGTEGAEGAEGEGEIAKSMDGDEDDEGGDSDPDEDEGGDEDEDDEEEGEDLDKSLIYDDDADDDLQKSIDASPVLSRLVDGIDNAFTGLQDVFAKSMAQQENVNEAMVKGLAANLQLTKSLLETVAQLQSQIEVQGAQPKPRKAAGLGGVLKKSVAGSQAPEDRTYGMSPDELQDKLIKGVRAGVVDLGMANHFDRTGTVPEAVFAKIKDL